MYYKFYHSWAATRALLITLTALFVIAFCIKGNCWNLEMEYTGPGSEADYLDKQCRDRDNERARDRCREGSEDSRDVRGAMEWERDHCA